MRQAKALPPQAGWLEFSGAEEASVQSEKCDVVIRFDEANDRLVLLSVPSSRLDEFFQQPHAAWLGGLGRLRALGHEGAESLVGLRALRELDRHSSSGLGLRDFEAHEREELRAMLSVLEQQATAGAPAAQLEAFRALWNQALKQKSLPLLEQADGFLQAAVAQGYAPAVAVAGAWPRLRAEAEASIADTAT